MIIGSFLLNNWLDIFIICVLYFLIVLPVLPPFFAGLQSEYIDVNTGQNIKQKKVSLIESIPHLLIKTLTFPFIITIPIRGAVTIVLLAALAADLFLNKQITNNGVTLVTVGIVALYLEKVLDTAEEISLWKVFTWKARKPTLNIPLTEKIKTSIEEK